MTKTVKQTKRKPSGAAVLGPGPGRPKGSRNKIPLFLKDALLKAGDLTGYDMKGKNGLVGYCQYLAENEPRTFAALLGKVLPIQVHATGGDDDEGNSLPMRVEVVR